MEEEQLYDRIGETDFNPTYVDGQTFQHVDVNKIVSITKEGVNENYYDIQKLQNGTKSVGNALQLDGATLSKYLDEPLQANDDKVPTSQQVKEYVDGLFSTFSPPIRGVDYWTEEDKEEIVDEAAQSVLNPTGEYDNTITYSKMDMVTYQGSSYIAIQSTLGNLPTNTNYWLLFAKGGIYIDYNSDLESLKIIIQGTIEYDDTNESLVFDYI